MLLSFQDIIGQEKAKTFLATSFANRKVSHAYLFRGPSGVGKKSMARAFAALVNCHNAESQRICGRCPSCLKFASDNHPDFLHIQPSGASIKIDQIRELKRQLTYSPFEGKYRVILLDDIHQNLRGTEAANSLLKSLEEPPPYSVFILTADEAGEILPTIHSRCQIIPFYPLPHEEIISILESKGTDRLAATALAGLSEGSLGKARLLLEKDLFDLRREIAETIISCSRSDPDVDRIFTVSDKATALKGDVEKLLDLISNWFRDIVMSTRGLGDRLINPDLGELTSIAAGRWSLEELLEKLECIQLARKQLQRNCNSGLVLEVLFFELL